MYESFYQLRDDPFRLLPDPRVCFAHSSCAKAWAYLHYALKRGEGIVVVTGPSGSGKTTLAERLLTGLNPSKVVSVRLIANDLNPTDLLRKLGYSLGLPVEGLDRAMLSHRIERYLIELEHSQRRALVLIDEAQTLSHQSLESMRLMTDMQSRSRPVFQLILLGQEGLEDVMSAPGMEQFQQRVIASCRLQTMTLEETKAYIEYRLEAADWTGDPSVNGPAIKAIYDYSHGLPRHVNKICSRLLLHGSTEEKHALNERDVTAVVRDLRDELLAPLHDDADRASEGSQGIFDPVHGLALTPSPRAQVVQVPSALPPTPEPCLADAPPVDEAPMQPVADSQSLTRPSWSGRAASFASWRRVPASTTGERGNYQRYSAALWRWPRPVMAGLGIAAAGAVAILSWQFNGPTATASKPRLELGTTSVEGRGYVLNDDQGRLGLPYGSVLDLGISAQDAPADASDGWQTALDFGQAAAGVAQDEIWDSVADTRRPGSGLDSVARRPANLEDPASAAAPATAEPDAGGDQLLPPDPGKSGDAPTVALETRLRDAEGKLQIADSTQDLADVSAERSASIMPDEQYTGLDLAPVPPAAAVDSASAAEETSVSAPLPLQPGLEEQPVLVDAASLLLAPTLDVDAEYDAQYGLPVAAAPPEAFDDSASADEGEVIELLALADQALAEDRLLFPEQSSAFFYLQRVLEMQPDNEDAQAGISRIALRYVELARAALRDAAYDRAVLYVERGSRIARDDAALRAVDGEISQALAAIEAAEAAEAAAAAQAAAERERMIAASKAKANLEPEEPKLSSLELLMRDLNGL